MLTNGMGRGIYSKLPQCHSFSTIDKVANFANISTKLGSNQRRLAILLDGASR
ncbi:hypothetical protein LguiB_032938 [Lonicera macranthoides]